MRYIDWKFVFGAISLAGMWLAIIYALPEILRGLLTINGVM